MLLLLYRYIAAIEPCHNRLEVFWDSITILHLHRCSDCYQQSERALMLSCQRFSMHHPRLPTAGRGPWVLWTHGDFGIWSRLKKPSRIPTLSLCGLWATSGSQLFLHSPLTHIGGVSGYVRKGHPVLSPRPFSLQYRPRSVGYCLMYLLANLLPHCLIYCPPPWHLSSYHLFGPPQQSDFLNCPLEKN